jgi:hypothetical protein
MDDPDEGCAGTRESVTVDGSPGLLCGALAVAWEADRGFEIRLYTSGDEPWLDTYYDQTWFRGVLDTVQLDPAAAVDAVTSPSPSSS